MELSESLFMEITGVRPSTPIYDAGPNKRGHTRVSFGARARIFPLMESATGCGSPVMVRDLSRSGVGFQLYDEMSVGDEFVLHLTKQTGESVNLQCMVQRCEPGGTGLVQFVVGATFELVLTEAQWHEPKITQIAERGTLHPQLPSHPQAVTHTPDPESSKIRSRLSSMSSKLADRLAPSTAVAEPAIVETPLVLTAEPVLPAEMLAKARSALFGPSGVESPAVEAVAAPVPAVPKAAAVPVVELPPAALAIPAPEAMAAARIEAPAVIKTQPELAPAVVEVVAPAIELPAIPAPVIEPLVTPAAAVLPAVVVEPVAETSVIEFQPQPELIASPVVEAPAAVEDAPVTVADEIDAPAAFVVEAEPTPVVAEIEQTPALEQAILVPAVESVAPTAASDEPTAAAMTIVSNTAEPVVELVTAIEPQPAVVAELPKVESTLAADVTLPNTTTPIVVPNPVKTQSKTTATNAAAVPTIASTQNGASSMVVIVVPSSMFTDGQKTISISAGGMDVTVSVASARPANFPSKPAIVNAAFDSTFDLLSEVVNPTDELLATA